MSKHKQPQPKSVRTIETSTASQPMGLFDLCDQQAADALQTDLYSFYRAMERCPLDRFSTIIMAALHPTDETKRNKARKLFRLIDLNLRLCPCGNGDVSPFD